MKKTYIRPSFAVFAITTASIVAMSGVKMDSTKEGDDMCTSKKDNADMWGNDNSKGIWD